MTQEVGFSGQVDHFGLATTSGDYILKLHRSSSSPHPKGTEDATDENGDKVARGTYIGGPGTPVECEYKLVSGTLDLSDLVLGAVNDTIRNDLEVNTVGGDAPTIKVMGILYTDPPAHIRTWTPPAITITGIFAAQRLGFNALNPSHARMTGSTLKMNAGTIKHVLADKDTIGNVGISDGCVLTISINMTYTVSVPTVTFVSPVDDIVVLQSPTSDGEITGWTTGTLDAEKIILPDVVGS